MMACIMLPDLGAACAAETHNVSSGSLKAFREPNNTLTHTVEFARAKGNIAGKFSWSHVL